MITAVSVIPRATGCAMRFISSREGQLPHGRDDRLGEASAEYGPTVKTGTPENLLRGSAIAPTNSVNVSGAPQGAPLPLSV